jgi:hypothetical protein
MAKSAAALDIASDVRAVVTEQRRDALGDESVHG